MLLSFEQLWKWALSEQYFVYVGENLIRLIPTNTSLTVNRFNCLISAKIHYNLDQNAYCIWYCWSVLEVHSYLFIYMNPLSL